MRIQIALRQKLNCNQSGLKMEILPHENSQTGHFGLCIIVIGPYWDDSILQLQQIC